LKENMKSQKKGILCPNCGKLVSSDEPKCPYCGHGRPGAVWKLKIGKSRLGDSAQLVRYIIYINIGMFVLSLLLSARGVRVGMNPLTALSPDPLSLKLLGASGAQPIDQYHRWWSLVAANYLHGSLLHIVFNMMAFRQLAPFIIREFGTWRFILIYSLGGVIGFWISYWAGVPLTIGASGAVCALIGAILYYSKSRGGTYGQALYKQVSGWVLGLFMFGLIVPGINNWGHGGGLLGGILLGYILGYTERRPEIFVHRLIAYIMVLVTGFTLPRAVSTAILIRIGEL
jgi:rhomboid protease GluP